MFSKGEDIELTTSDKQVLEATTASLMPQLQEAAKKVSKAKADHTEQLKRLQAKRQPVEPAV